MWNPVLFLVLSTILNEMYSYAVLIEIVSLTE